MPSTNIIAIDPSTSCTGICYNGKVACFSSEAKVFTKKRDLTKWFGIASEAAKINSYPELTKVKGEAFSHSEVGKLNHFDSITDSIIDFLQKEVNISSKDIVLIEGYSYSSEAGHIIDLVTFSTLLRKKLKSMGVNLIVVQPSELKMLAAKTTYAPKDVGKRKPKLRWENPDGVAGGSFKKPEMYRAITDNATFTDDWTELLREHFSDIMSMNKIPTPLDDINDAFLLYHAYQANLINT